MRASGGSLGRTVCALALSGMSSIAPASAAAVLRSAQVTITVPAPASCRVSMTLVVDGATSIDHRLEAPDGTLLIGGDALTPCTSSWPWGMFILRLDAGGNLIASRTVENGDDNAEAFLMDLAVGADGSVFASGDIQGTVDFDDGPGKVVRSAGSGAAGFAMKMRPDFSLIAAVKTAANQNFLGLIAPAPGGGLVGVEHHDNAIFGGVSDPYLVTLDANLALKSSLRLAGTYSYVNGLAVGGGVIAVVGTGPANEYIPGASGDTVPNGLFLARYRF